LKSLLFVLVAFVMLIPVGCGDNSGRTRGYDESVIEAESPEKPAPMKLDPPPKM
jgi:hypothetical protein